MLGRPSSELVEQYPLSARGLLDVIAELPGVVLGE